MVMKNVELRSKRLVIKQKRDEFCDNDRVLREIVDDVQISWMESARRRLV